jgi:ubiquinone/menaquinone biosynthesis C-methylase UbiE
MVADVEFDGIAPIYDETRPAPSEAELGALCELLAGCRTILDAGVGTGRFAVPLRARQFEIVGVDLSLGMMRRARAKGIARLVRADLRRLPLSDGSVDAAFLAHVLQLVPEPRPLLGELGRVTRSVVVALLPQWGEHRPAGTRRRLMERYRALAAELGYPLPERGKRYEHTLEQLSAIAPPKAVRTVTGPSRDGQTFDERFARWAALSLGRNQLPPEVHAEIVRRLKAEFPIDLARTLHPREARFVVWDSPALARAAP